MVFRNHAVGAGCAHCYSCVIASRLLNVHWLVTVKAMDISKKGKISASVTCHVVWVAPHKAVWSGGNNWARCQRDVGPSYPPRASLSPVHNGGLNAPTMLVVEARWDIQRSLPYLCDSCGWFKAELMLLPLSCQFWYYLLNYYIYILSHYSSW